jgi:[ribosomal protein S5]-alanine N-acetyltransferase
METHKIFESFPEKKLTRPYHLRLPSRQDAEAYLAYIRHPKVACYIPDSSLPRDETAAAECLQYFRDLYHRRQAIYWSIHENATGRMVGSCGFEHWYRYHSRLEVAYDLHPDFWGQGIMSEALRTILQTAFTTMEANRIDAFTTTDNLPSIHLLEKLGFVRDGTLREYRQFKGKFIDVLIFGRLKNDH